MAANGAANTGSGWIAEKVPPARPCRAMALPAGEPLARPITATWPLGAAPTASGPCTPTWASGPSAEEAGVPLTWKFPIGATRAPAPPGQSPAARHTTAPGPVACLGSLLGNTTCGSRPGHGLTSPDSVHP